MKLRNILDSIVKRSSSSKKLSFQFSSDIPEVIEEEVIYIIGEKKFYWMALFYCPCGCKEVIKLNLLKEASPQWQFFIKWGRITFHPSIWRKVGCKSHFHVKKGNIKWSYV